MRELPVRKANRLNCFDYRQCGAYYVTICSKDRAELFGRVGATVPGRPCVELTETGRIIDNAINYYNDNVNNINFVKYVIMPNHVHAIIIIGSDAGDRGRSPLQYTIRNLKSYISKQIGFSPWQKSFHDHIIRNTQDYNRIVEYIDNNPENWECDNFYVGEKP